MDDLTFLGLKLDELKRVQRRIERLEHDVLLFAQTHIRLLAAL